MTQINKVLFVTSDDTLTVEVVLSSEVPCEVESIPVFIQKINGLECYIIDMYDIEYTQIHFKYKDNWYMVRGENKQELIKIVEKLKELE